MDCPNCGGEVWNNAQKNRDRESEGKKPLPLYACKDKDGCKWVQWPPRNATAAKPAPRAQGTPPAPSVRSTRPLGPLYYACMKIAAATVKQHIGDKATPADIVAACATLFIGATNTGAPLAPPPKPAPEPEPEQDDGGSMGAEGYDF